MSTKKKAGASLRDALRDLLAQIALDQRRRHQHGEAEPQRQHDDGRRRAGPVQIGERQPQAGELGLADPRRRPHQAARQQREGDEGATAPSTNQPAMLRLSAVKMVKAASTTATAPISSASRHGSRRRPPTTAPRIRVAAGHAARAHQRHQGEHQRDQQAERPGDGERLGVERRRARAPAAPRRSATGPGRAAPRRSTTPISDTRAGQARRAAGNRSTRPAVPARRGISGWRWCAAGRPGSSRWRCRRRRRRPAARRARSGR